MEVILEIVHPHGARTRHRLDALPLTLGRGLANDLVLDDPYVDARHARIARDESGELTIEDLGSVNGVFTNGEKTADATRVHPGDAVRVGRTVLRFRDPAEPVSPALIDDATPGLPLPASPAVGTAHRRREPALAMQRSAPILARWIGTAEGRLTIVAAATTGFAVYSWLGSAERSAAGDVIGGALGFGLFAAIWAGLWAVGTRVAQHRFHFMSHYTVISAMSIVALAWTILGEWQEFLFPGSDVGDVVGTAFGVVVIATLIAWHLSVSSSLSRRHQWRLGWITAGTIFGVLGLAALAIDDSFSDVASFSGVVKPIAARWVPTTKVDDFSDVMQELKKDVDEIAEKAATKGAK